MRTLFSLCLLSLMSGLATGQGVPKGGGNFFGASQSQVFNEKAVFAGPPKMPDLLPAQAQVPAGSPAALLAGEPAPPPPKLWTGGLELGLNGATGNSEQFNIRSGWFAQRKTDTNIFNTDFLYAISKQGGVTNQNQMIINARDELLTPGSPWTYFGSTNIEYDELRSYKFRVGVYGGIGYIVLNDDITLFKVRAGAGVVREIGGPADRWVPEMVFGYDLNHKLSDRQSLISALDYYPRIDNFAQYRVRARAAYEIIVDPESGTALRFGAQLRYDSDPGSAKRADLTYFAALVMKF